TTRTPRRGALQCARCPRLVRGRRPAAQLALELLAGGLGGGLLAESLELLLGLRALGQLVGGAGFLQVLVDLAGGLTGLGERRRDVLGLLTGLAADAESGGQLGLALVALDAGGE